MINCEQTFSWISFKKLFNALDLNQISFLKKNPGPYQILVFLIRGGGGVVVPAPFLIKCIFSWNYSTLRVERIAPREVSSAKKHAKNSKLPDIEQNKSDLNET